MAGIDRVGQGWDVHRLVEGRRLVLGGVEVPWRQGLAGHSDADVVVHAVIDALLGGAGLGDIGELFPDTDAAYAEADSGVLLRDVVGRVSAAGYAVVNADVTVIAERPRLVPYKPMMRRRLAEMLKVEMEAVNVKAKTAEGLGALGAGEGIACQAVVGLRKVNGT